jgi:hypothetical protein
MTFLADVDLCIADHFAIPRSEPDDDISFPEFLNILLCLFHQFFFRLPDILRQKVRGSCPKEQDHD